MTHTALITGGNRGIGFEACRQLGQAGLRVVLTSRNPSHGSTAADRLRAEGYAVIFEELDVSDEASVNACARRLRKRTIDVDVLVNNAGVYPPGPLLGLSTERLQETLTVNFFGAFWTCQAFVPAMVKRGYGRVVNVSSGGGSLTEGLPGPAASGLSKAALNALTVKLATEVRGDVKVNAMCPGWVRTRMGGTAAPRSVAEAVNTLMWLATLPADGPTGMCLRDRQQIPW